MANKKTILITGATGFIGRRLVKSVVKSFKGSKIICLGNDVHNAFEEAGEKLLRKYSVEFMKLDLTKTHKKELSVIKPNIVIHLAANTHTEDSNHDVNDIGTNNLLKGINLQKTTHFIHISTTAFMGNRISCATPLTETSACKPTNTYGRTKYNAEQIIQKYQKKIGFKLTVLRLNTVYGSGMRKNSFFDAITQMVKKNSIVTRINWPSLTSLVHVDDVVYVTIKIALNPPRGRYEMYLVSSENVSLSDICKIITVSNHKKYRQITIPRFIWKLASFTRLIIPHFEKIIPLRFYNFVWRFTLIVDSAIYCDNSKIIERVPDWKPRLLKDHIKEVL